MAYKTDGKLYLRSRNDNDFSTRYPAVAKAISALPNEAVVDGEIVAFNETGKPLSTFSRKKRRRVYRLGHLCADGRSLNCMVAGPT